MDTEATNKTIIDDETEKSNVPDIIRQISEIQVPSHIIENIDVKGIGQRFAGLFEELDEAQKNFKELNNAGIIKKFWWALTGKTTEILLDAQQIQAELAKLQSMLIMLNTMFAKELNRQQTLISNQQKIIEEQNSEIRNQQDELERQNKKIIETQEVILKLVHLTNEQEEVLKELFSKADYIKEVENKLSKDICDTRLDMKDMKAVYEKNNSVLKSDFNKIIENNMKALMEHFENINGEITVTRESFEGFGKSYALDKEYLQSSIDQLHKDGTKNSNDTNQRILAIEKGFNQKLEGLRSKGLIALGVVFSLLIILIILLIFRK